MIYRVAFYNKSLNETWSAGVYAPDDDQARQIGAILLTRAHNYHLRADQIQIIQVPGLTSTVMTTT